nr:type VII secretion protein EssB/YukC [Paraliobacillus ryukyuensis]
MALLSDKQSFDYLYNGGLESSRDIEFEKQVQKLETIDELFTYLQTLYNAEQLKTDRTMKLVSIKHFNLYKRLSYIFGVLLVLLSLPFIYTRFVTLPHLENIQESHEAFVVSDFDNVITALADEEAENLSHETQYILANAYLAKEDLSEQDKSVIMDSMSPDVEEQYVLYWMYNGRNKLDEAMDTAKYLDDPQLIMYGLIKQIEQTNSNPELSGTERQDRVADLEAELQTYTEEYNLEEDGELRNNSEE